MTASTATSTDVDVVRALFGTFASGDLAALADLLHADATWHHHNDDRLGGMHRGADAIIAYLTESALVTAGTLHAEPQSVMADDAIKVDSTVLSLDQVIALIVRAAGDRGFPLAGRPARTG